MKLCLARGNKIPKPQSDINLPVKRIVKNIFPHKVNRAMMDDSSGETATAINDNHSKVPNMDQVLIHSANTSEDASFHNVTFTKWENTQRTGKNVGAEKVL